MPFRTLSGNVGEVAIGRLGSLALGSKRQEQFEVSCIDLRKAFALDRGIQGILGQDFLHQLNYLLDYKERKVEIDESGALVSRLRGSRVSIEQDSFRVYVLVPGGPGENVTVRLLLDSGSKTPVLFTKASQAPPFDLDQDNSRSFLMSSTVGNRALERYRLRVLRLGSETFRHLPVFVTPARDEENRREDGLLPTSLFRSVYFDHARSFVILNARPSR